MCFANVHTYKKKLKPSGDKSIEITYDYLLSLFVSKFNYTVNDFDLLTPSQAYLILNSKREIEEYQIELLRTEFRLNNYFTIKSAMGDSSNIKEPSDLYHLAIDDEIKAYHQRKLQEYKPDPEFIKWANQYLSKN